MAIQEKQLAQSRPNDITAVSVYSPAASTTAIIKIINVCNVTTSTANFSIYQDDDGSTYSENTALHYDQAVPAKTTIQVQGFYPMNDSNGNLAVQSSVANALTFTVTGTEIA